MSRLGSNLGYPWRLLGVQPSNNLQESRKLENQQQSCLTQSPRRPSKEQTLISIYDLTTCLGAGLYHLIDMDPIRSYPNIISPFSSEDTSSLDSLSSVLSEISGHKKSFSQTSSISEYDRRESESLE